MRKLVLVLTTLMMVLNVFAQDRNYTQTIRGQVMDKQTNMSLPGATVIVISSDPLIGTSANEKGYFILEKVPIGRISIEVSYVGYQSAVIDNLNVTTGKELILNAELEEKVITQDEVVITAAEDKTQAINDMAIISARTFTVEESQRYAGARNDVARMAANYAGISSYNDAVNDIVIRGNSSDGLLWQLEGIPIPNPNHFGQLGATGGPVNMLNNNVLSNSDFLTGAFPGEYGNALSGVFDLKFRPGNYEKHEFLGQVGFNGFELGVEGPVSRKNNSSYLANYRYSTMGVMSALGIEFGTGNSIPYYQDLSFNVVLPVSKSGRFQVFGLGGINHITFMSSTLDPGEQDENLYSTENLDIYSRGKMGVAGANYTWQINPTMYAKFTLAASYIYSGGEVDTLLSDPTEIRADVRRNDHKYDFVADARLTKKFNSKNLLRTGFIFDRIGFNIADSSYYEEYQSFKTNYESDGYTFLSQVYAEWQHRFSEKLELNTGFHFQELALNGDYSLEPRASVRWNFRSRQSLNFGYGLHSKAQPTYVYFRRTEVSPGDFRAVNENIGFTRTHHFIAGYDLNITQNFRLKAETYYQYLFDVPVETKSSNYSMLNLSSFQQFTYDTLANNGHGRNYGIELTLEKFLSKGFYFLATVSVYDSKYEGSDGVLRSTAFDSKYISNLVGGKEFRLNGKNTQAKYKTWISVDTKLTAAGGMRYTPVDIAKSAEEGYTVYDEAQAFSKQFTDYFRLDLRVAYRLDARKVSHELALDVQNITNHKNPIYMQFNPKTGQDEFMYQLEFFPMAQYRIIF